VAPQKPLRSLLDVGLLNPLSNSTDGRRQYYLRRDSAAWAWALELAGRAHVMCET
jgi:hypothetical protein